MSEYSWRPDPHEYSSIKAVQDLFVGNKRLGYIFRSWDGTWYVRGLHNDVFDAGPFDTEEEAKAYMVVSHRIG